MSDGGCLACGRFLHDECETDPCCCHGKKSQTNSISLEANPYEKAFYKRDEDVRDPKSTGRKRAAVLYKVDPNSPCDWRGFKRVGGGTNPIIGCLNGFQKHRHHGPDKDTLNNEPGNVHLICNNCHNRWHNGNDWCLDSSIPHNPESATTEELIKNETAWAVGKYAEWTNKRKEFFASRKDSEHLGDDD